MDNPNQSLAACLAFSTLIDGSTWKDETTVFGLPGVFDPPFPSPPSSIIVIVIGIFV
jgi:hypothetical protein